jgi:drug/metabolite transporter (DMT)-like permease
VTASTADEERWAEALTALEHGPTPLIRARVRRLRLVVLGVVVLLLIPALTIPFLRPDRPDRPAHEEPATALEVAGLVVMGVAILVEFTAIVLLFRANRGRWMSPLAALTQQQNRELRAHVRGQAPLPPERLPLARYLADSMLRQRPVVLVLLGAALLWAGMALLTPSLWRTAIAVAFGGLVVAAWLTTRREERRATRFLGDHPEPAA